MLSTLNRWVRGRTAPRPTLLTFRVYCREHCGCCDKAMETLRDFQTRYDFPIDVVDVDSDPELAERHGLFVPVVEVSGKVRFKGKVNPVLLQRLFDAEGRDD